MHPKYSQTKHLKNKARTCFLRLRTCYDYGCDQSSMRRCTCHIIRRSMRRYTRDKHTRSCIHQLHVYQQHIPTCIVYSHLHACIKEMKTMLLLLFLKSMVYWVNCSTRVPFLFSFTMDVTLPKKSFTVRAAHAFFKLDVLRYNVRSSFCPWQVRCP